MSRHLFLIKFQYRDTIWGVVNNGGGPLIPLSGTSDAILVKQNVFASIRLLENYVATLRLHPKIMSRY